MVKKVATCKYCNSESLSITPEGLKEINTSKRVFVKVEARCNDCKKTSELLQKTKYASILLRKGI